MEKPSEDIQMQEIESIIQDEPIYHYNLWSQVQNIETEDTNSETEDINFEIEDNSKDSKTKIQLSIKWWFLKHHWILLLSNKKNLLYGG